MSTNKNPFLYVYSLLITLVIPSYLWYIDTPLVTSDEHLRIFTANLFRFNPSFQLVNGEFLPGHTILNSLFLSIYPDTIWTPRIANLIAALILTFLVVKIINSFPLKTIIKFSLVSFFAFFPVGLWLATAPFSEIFTATFFIAGLNFYIATTKLFSPIKFFTAIAFFTIASTFRIEITFFLFLGLIAWGWELYKNPQNAKKAHTAFLVLPLLYGFFHILQRHKLVNDFFSINMSMFLNEGAQDAIDMKIWLSLMLIPPIASLCFSRFSKSIFKTANLLIFSAIASWIFIAFFSFKISSRPTAFPDRITYLPMILSILVAGKIMSVESTRTNVHKILSFTLLIVSCIYFFIAFNVPKSTQKDAYLLGETLRAQIPDRSKSLFLVEQSGWGWTVIGNFIYPGKIVFDRSPVHSPKTGEKASILRISDFQSFSKYSKEAGINMIIVRSQDIKDRLDKVWKLTWVLECGQYTVYRSP